MKKFNAKFFQKQSNGKSRSSFVGLGIIWSTSITSQFNRSLVFIEIQIIHGSKWPMVNQAFVTNGLNVGYTESATKS